MSQTSTATPAPVEAAPTDTIRLLYITDALYMGSDTRCEALMLEKLSKQRYSIAAVTVPRGPAAEHLSGMPGVAHLPVHLGTFEPGEADGARSKLTGGVRFGSGLIEVALAAWRFRPHVVMCGDRTRSMIAAMVAAKVARARLIYHPGSFYTTEYANAQIKRWCALSADLVLVNSRFSRQSYIGAGAPSDKLMVAYNGIDAERFVPGNSDEIRARYGIPVDSPLIGMFSQLRPYKGHDTVLKAMPGVLAAVPNAHLLLVGPGDLRADMEALSARLGITEHVTFTGHVDDLVPLYQATDVFIMASDEEPFGMVTIEAMACEKAAIGTNTGGTPEIIAEGETGLLVPPRQVAPVTEALVALLCDPDRRRIMGQRGRQRVLRQFTQRGRTEQVSAALEQLVTSSRSQRH